MEKLAAKHIRGEFEVWIYHYYLAPSFHYFLAVNQTITTRIQNLEAVSTRKMKRWLSLLRNATQVLLYHLEVMKISQLSTIELKEKITYLTAIVKSQDPLVHQLQELLVSNYVQQNLKISTFFKDYFNFPISQILTTPKKNLTNKIEHLSDLKVQSKFKKITIVVNYTTPV